MFTSLTVERYRPFKKLTVEPLARVNLIAGSNDVGKTALLEAVFLLVAEGNLSLLPTINSFRGPGTLQGDPDAVSDWLWAPMFHQFSFEKPIKINARQKSGKARGVEFKLVPRPSTPVTLMEEPVREAGSSRYGFSSKALRMEFSDSTDRKQRSDMLVDIQGIHVDPPPGTPSTPSYFLASSGRIPQQEVAKDFGDLEVLGRPYDVEEMPGLREPHGQRAGRPYDVEEILRILEPRLRRVATIAGPGGPILYGDVGLSRMLPLALLGDGMTRLASIVLKIAANAHGVVLVDEIENGLYHAVMEPVWTAIGQAARLFDVQIFATTHSWECLQAAHNAFSSGPIYDLRLHRLERVREEIRAVSYDQETLGVALKAELEVR